MPKRSGRKRFGIVGGGNGWYVRDLQRAAAADEEVVAVPYTRLLAEAASSRCAERSAGIGLAEYDCLLLRAVPAGTLQQIVFRLDVLGQAARSGVAMVNSPRTMEIAVDKYLATARLAAAGLPVPETVVCQRADEALAAYERLGGDVVVKPLFGSEGQGMHRVTSTATAATLFGELVENGDVLYLQRFIPHAGRDFRVLTIGDDALVMARTNRHDWRTNISLGGSAEAVTLDAETIDLARRAAAVTGATLAGVDLLPDGDGAMYVLEVNAAPGWRALAGTLNVDVSRRVLDHLRQVAASREKTNAASIC
ncbi:MAG: RimK family alpha-L-glutamate ligase [Pirellulales bacterium]